MSDRNETNHAACNLYPISDEDIERLQSAAAFDGILLTRSSIRAAARRRDDLPEVVKQELDRLFPQTTLKESVQHLCQQVGLSEILTTASLIRLQKALLETLSSHLERLHPGAVQTEVLIGWCSLEQTFESPFMFVAKHMMDDGGRYGNVPPNLLQNTMSEKEEIGGSNATGTPCKSRKYAEEEVCKRFSIPASEIEREQ